MKRRIDLNVPEKSTEKEGTSTSDEGTTSSAGEKSKEEKAARFRYGNYNRYYGMRTKGFERDPRLDLLSAEWFKGKAVLDVGCNVGYLTLAIAKDFQPSHILGIDIDENLVGVARKNIRHYCDGSVEISGKYPSSFANQFTRRNKDFASTGKIRFDEQQEEQGEKGDATTSRLVFPNNVWFLRDNYVLEVDEDLEMVREDYDVILALSITKWVHINWGDAGLKRFFRRAFLHLRPAGRFIVEFQAWETYAKKSKIMEETREHYRNIAFKPDAFADYLLSPEVGFEKCEELGVPKAASKGFERPLLCFTKTAFDHRQQRDEPGGRGVGAGGDCERVMTSTMTKASKRKSPPVDPDDVPGEEVAKKRMQTKNADDSATAVGTNGHCYNGEEPMES